jgi:glycosyltransferase involved in cell wall biosynthesis
VLDDAADTFVAGDADAGAQRVLELIARPETAAAQAARTRQRAVTLFTAERTASRWFAIYNQEAAQ